MNMQINTVVTGTLADLRRTWVVYSLVDVKSFKPLHVGMCRAVEVMETPDAALPADLPMVLTILETHGDRTTATKRQRGYAALLGVARVMAGAGGVECVATGERWRTAKDCALSRDIDQAALSRHLRGTPGHNKVNGLKYRRIVVDNRK